MTITIKQLTSDQATLPSDGTLPVTLSALIADDAETPKISGVTVNWAVDDKDKGKLSKEKSTTDDNGIATVLLSALDSGRISVTATTEEDQTGKTLYLTATKPLEAPTVYNATKADGYTLDQYDIAFGVSVSIPFYSNAETGQSLTFYWGDQSLSFPVEEPSEQFPYIINLQEEMPSSVLEDGEYQVYYKVLDQAQNESLSSALTITIEHGGETEPTLNAPLVPEADPYINISDANDGVEVEVAYDSMAAGDIITLYWYAYDKDGNSLSSASISPAQYSVVDGEASHTFTIPTETFFPTVDGYEGKAEVYYTVRKAQDVTLSLSTTVLVDTRAP